jgi:hypothetical protein
MSRIRCVEHTIQEGVANKGDPKVRVTGRRVVAQKISQLKTIHQDMNRASRLTLMTTPLEWLITSVLCERMQLLTGKPLEERNF